MARAVPVLRLTYSDKYRLWSDLVRSSTDRMFIPTRESVTLGSTVSVEIRLPKLGLPIVIQGRTVGRRPTSRRFEAGIYLRIPEHELEKCRRFLGLRRPIEADARARQALRLHRELPVRFLEPALEARCITKNISETGVFVAGDVDLVAGQQVCFEVELIDGEPRRLDALVAWAAPDQGAAGLELIDLGEEGADSLRKAIEHLALAEPEVRTTGPRPIVVADDDPAVLLLLNRALSRHGFDVYQASDGDQAVELIRRLQPSLVVLDVLLPGVDGAHICKTMRADAELSDIPVVLVSALEADALHDVADECGATDYLNKPLHLGELLDIIGGYLSP